MNISGDLDRLYDLAKAVERLSNPQNPIVRAAIQAADHEKDEWHANRRAAYDCAEELPTNHIYNLQVEIRNLRKILQGDT